MRCAIIVSYVNGASALTKIFSKDRKKALFIINKMTVKNFCMSIKKHPSKQAFYYLTKVMKIYSLI